MAAESNPSLSNELPLHAAWVQRLARRLVRDEAGAEDLAQEVALAALRSPDPPERRPWLARVTANLAARGFRSEAARERGEREAARPEREPATADVAARLELQRTLVSELERLDEPYRSALVHRFFDGWSAARIARETGVPAPTVRWRIQRGLSELRARLDRRSGGDGITWRLALLPLARGPSPAGALSGVPHVAAAALQGVLAVKLSTLLLSAGALALAVGVGILLRSGEAPPEAEQVAAADAPLASGTQASPAETTPSAVEAQPPAREAVDVARAPAAELATPAAAPKTQVAGRCVTESLASIEGALVFDPSFDVRRGTRSAADGAFLLECVAETPVRELRVEAEGFGTRFVDARVTSGETSELGDVVLRPGGSVVGRVRDALGAPFADATVSVTDPRLSDEYEAVRRHGLPEGAQALTATSAPDGSFRVDGVTAGPVRAWASADGMLHAVSAVLEVPAHGLAEVELVLEPRTSADRIAGIVLDPSGTPASSASVAALRRSTAGQQWLQGPIVDADGRFAMPAAQDSVYDVYAFDGQSRWLRVGVEGVRPGTLDLELAFQDSPWIEVRARSRGELVRTFEARAVTLDGDTVSWSEEKQPAEGVARLRAATIPFRVRVEAAGYAIAERGPFEPSSVPGMLEVELEPHSGVRGRVTAYGEPVAGARVTLHRWPTKERVERSGFPTWIVPDEQCSATSDADGRFVLSPRERGSFAVRAAAPGLAADHLGPLELDPDRGSEGVELVLTRGGALEGRVRMPPGRDPSGVIVGLNRGDGHPRTVRSDRDGSFRFDDLAPGRWHLARAKVDFLDRLASTGFSAGGPPTGIPFNCLVADGQTVHQDLDLSGWEPCRIEGRLLVNGAAADGWLLTVWPDPQQAVTTPLPSTATAADGRFELEVDEAGAVLFSFQPPAEEGGQGGITVPVKLEPGLNPWTADLAMGSVEGRRETPLAEDDVLFYQSAEDATPFASLPITLDDDGHFRLPYVPAGAGRVRLLRQSEPFGWELLAEVEVAARATARVELP